MKLTKLEQFVWDNQHRSATALATELNRSEASITRAFNKAYEKMREMQAKVIRKQSR